MITLPLNSVFILNSITVVIFLLFVVGGFSRGLIHQLLDLIGFVAGLVLAWVFAPQLASQWPLLSQEMDFFNQPLIGQPLHGLANTVLWFAIIWIGLSILMTFIVKPFAKFIHKVPIANSLNRLFGAVYGLIPATLLSLLLAFVLTTPVFSNGRSTVEASGMLKPFLGISDFLLSEVYQQSDSTGILQKVMAGETLTLEDLENLPDWLETLGISESLKEPLNKLIQGQSLDTLDLEAIQSYIDEHQVTQEDLSALMKRFSLTDEEITSALNALQFK